jgi:hypothetical protein
VIARQIETVGALLSVRKVLVIAVVVILNKEKLGHMNAYVDSFVLVFTQNR